MVQPAKRPFWLVALLLLLPFSAAAEVHHELSVTLEPQTHGVAVVDTVTLPEAPAGPVQFTLHAGIVPEILDSRGKLRQLESRSAAEPAVGKASLSSYALDLAPGARSFTLKYSGDIFHAVQKQGEEYARSFGSSAGLIGPEGVFLSGSSGWYPNLGDSMVTFSLSVDLPAGWRSVSQGVRSGRREGDKRTTETWSIDKPQQEIYLVAAPFDEYDAPAGPAQAMVFLRKPEPALAQRYLDATGPYLEMYSRLIGPYAYKKFALVENFWESGYGMPSFTLLGPTVIRFPFILRSSYPHEILHNWWGNGVYVDYATGNWSEGLTAYLADHLLQEQQGQGADYRRAALQKYADYVSEKRDFPLTEFRARHSAATEAVGYGKALMMFHMLRRELGDPTFVEGLRRFYRDYLFKVASFQDIDRSFSAVAGRPLDAFFDQWVKRTGAPALRVTDARARPEADGFLLTALLQQVQPGEPYRLRIPLAVDLEGRQDAYQTHVDMDGPRLNLSLRLPARPVRLRVDPEFDLFRRLDLREIPPSLGQAFGAAKTLIVLPSAASPGLRQAYEGLARAWQGERQGSVEIRTDRDIQALPQDRAVWLLGWDNRFRPVLDQALKGYEFADRRGAVRVQGTDLARSERSVVLVARHPSEPRQALAWIAADNPAALPGLARKLPHYGKYSYLAFTGDGPDNVLKGQWPVLDSPMSVLVAQEDGKAVMPTMGRLAPRKPLAELPPPFSSERMMRDIGYLAAPEMAGRGLGTPELDRAAEYIVQQMHAAGLQPGGDRPGDWFQTWTAQVGEPTRPARLRNVIGVIPGGRPDWAGQSVVIGAHYDHLGLGWPDVHQGDQGKIHPGADDNASGVAVMLELARALGHGWRPARTVVLVAFTGEEAGKLGSAHYVQRARSFPAAKVLAMINLDTVGRLGNRELLALGCGSAREWPHIFQGAGFVAGVPVRPVENDFGASDQTSFLAAGIPAVQLFAGVHADYHRPGDTPDKIDAPGLQKTATVLKEAVEYLAGREDPLTRVAGDEPHREAASHGRHVVLGTVPDFAYGGKGVRLTGVTPGTPAARGGLQAGDVIFEINGRAVDGLPDLADQLRHLEPGDSISVRYLRGGAEHTVQTHVVGR